MKIIFFALLVLISFSAFAVDLNLETIQPFTTDKCSSWIEKNPIFKADWTSCCKKHDVAYWMGGNKAERTKADKELRSCVAKSGDPVNAVIMWIGVRIGGKAGRNTSYRWGYGWHKDQTYKEMTPSQKRSVLQEMNQIVDEDLVELVMAKTQKLDQELSSEE